MTGMRGVPVFLTQMEEPMRRVRLFACFLVLGLITILMAPVMHRVLHRFHLEREREKSAREKTNIIK